MSSDEEQRENNYLSENDNVMNIMKMMMRMKKRKKK